MGAGEAQPLSGAYLVTDHMGRVALFAGDVTRAMNYAARVHGMLTGPMSLQAAQALLDAAAAREAKAETIGEASASSGH